MSLYSVGPDVAYYTQDIKGEQTKGNFNIFEYGEEIAHLRKAYMVHEFFARRTTSERMYRTITISVFLVTKECLEELKRRCEIILKDNTQAINLLPMSKGILLESQKYDKYYFYMIKRTLQGTKDALEAIERGHNILYVVMW